MVGKAYDAPKLGYAPFNPEPIFHKTKLCKFHEKGACTRGAHCVFAHGRGELSSKPDFGCTSLCPRLIRTGSCPGEGTTCRFAHTSDQLRPRVGARVPIVDTRNIDIERQLEQVQAKLCKTQQELKFLEAKLLRQRLQEAHEYCSFQHNTECENGEDCTKPTDDGNGPWSRQTTAESVVTEWASFSRRCFPDFGESDDDGEDFNDEDLRGLDDDEEDLNDEDLRGLNDEEEVLVQDKEDAYVSNPDLTTSSAGLVLPPPPGMVVKNTFLELDCATRTLRQVTSSPALLRLL